jgi:hypothetical protein
MRMIVRVILGVRMFVVVLVRMRVIVRMARAAFDQWRRHLIGRLAVNPGWTRSAASAFHAHD